MYKLVVFDLDDTLAAVGEPALADTIELLRKIEKNSPSALAIFFVFLYNKRTSGEKW